MSEYDRISFLLNIFWKKKKKKRNEQIWTKFLICIDVDETYLWIIAYQYLSDKYELMELDWHQKTFRVLFCLSILRMNI